MESKIIKINSKAGGVTLKVIPGHFATTHSHINYFIDMTTLKTRHNEAHDVAKALMALYLNNTVVDTIVCQEGVEVIGAFLAQELTNAGFMSINAHKAIYVVTPEQNGEGQMMFRDNLQPMIRGKHVLLLMSSITTGGTADRALECVQYYGGTVQGIAAIFSAVDEVQGHHVNSVFTPNDLPGYESHPYSRCPQCEAGKPVEAMVNRFGYSKL